MLTAQIIYAFVVRKEEQHLPQGPAQAQEGERRKRGGSERGRFQVEVVDKRPSAKPEQSWLAVAVLVISQAG